MNLDNFYIASFGIWKGCKKPKGRMPDFESGTSQYWYGADKKGTYIIRSSDHWSRGAHSGVRNVGMIRSCFWVINDKFFKPDIEYITGKIYIKDFKPVKKEKRRRDLCFFAKQKKAKITRTQKYFAKRVVG